MDYSSPLLLAARQFARKVGVASPLMGAYQRLFRLGYEESYDAAMMALVRPEDVIWDIGANVGLYTQKFAEAVGPRGRVYAIEPAPCAHRALTARFAGRRDVRCVNVALSDRGGSASFRVFGESAVNNALCEAGAEGTILVEVTTGDELVRNGACAVPNRIKLDVEGYECEALAGMRNTLRNEQVRSVFVEVHAAQMAARGLNTGPAAVVRELRAAGFSTTWADSSHVVAVRR